MENLNSFTCPICGNTDIHSIGHLNGKPYCRRCISFKGEEVMHKPSYPKKAPIHLSYELSPEQKELSNKLVENYKNGIDSLVFAVTGSGKTEISLAVIAHCIMAGGKVGFVIPRRDVVIEIARRLEYIFSENKVVSVYGGHVKHLVGDIICLTSHQLYRYNKYFDLLVMDEIDAFPFDKNKVLNSMFFRALKGHYIQMSATPSKEIVEHYSKGNKDVLKLSVRYHKHYLPLPRIIKTNLISSIINLFFILKRFQKMKKPVFVFFPTIDLCEKIFKIFKNLLKKVKCVHSKVLDRQEIIKAFSKGYVQALFTTAVLERGVTVKDLQIIIYRADHPIYTSASLIQIAGRAGRKIGATKGEVIFIAKNETNGMREAIKQIQMSNEVLQDMLRKNQGE